MPTYINAHNGVEGTPNFDARMVRAGFPVPASWDVVVAAMDDEIREQVHGELAPCSNTEFLARYLELASEPLVIG